MARKMVSEGINILGKAWSELKKINWHEVNRLCQQNFHIGLAGTREETAAMRAWLGSFPYVAAGKCVHDGWGPAREGIARYVTVMDPAAGELDEKMVKSTTFCLAGRETAGEVRRLKGEVYIFDAVDTYSLTTQILSNHHELQFALAHNFPVFRPELAQGVIQDTAFQNAAWATITGLPGAVPGPQILAHSFEGISDFTILTLNEIKLLFELVGLSGYRVVPLYHLVEFAMIVGLAKLGETAATTAVARLPSRAAVIAKGSIAYAFTWTIGEAIFFYLSTGHRMSRRLFAGRLRSRYGEGREVAEGLCH